MLPKQAGTYALTLRLSRPRTISIGRLGAFSFPAGWYAYAGSARGPGGLAARVGRHLQASKTRHWHIDYLRTHAKPVVIWYTTCTQSRECRWARALSQLPGASMPAPGFGASDCRCPAHLVLLPARPDRLVFAQLLDGPVCESLLSA
jgi:Uri superfamily endonuclease